VKIFKVGDIYICELNKKVVYYKGKDVSGTTIGNGILKNKDYKPCCLGSSAPIQQGKSFNN
jgi:hypothetical protein